MSLSTSSEHINGQGKRKRYEEEDGDGDSIVEHDISGYVDDDDEPFKFGTSVLPVARLPDSYEGIPQNGMEYLFTVRREERSLPLVTRVPNPYGVKEIQIVKSAISNGSGESSKGITLPSEEWRTCFEERFKNMRKNMRQSTIHIALPDTSPPKLPAMRDRDRWWAFFRGDVDWAKVPCSQFHNPQGKGKDTMVEQTRNLKPVVYQEALSWDDAEEGDVRLNYQPGEEEDGQTHLLPGEDEISQSQYPSNCQLISTSTHQSTNEPLSSCEPTPRILALLDQKFVLHLLKYFIQWIQGHFDHTFLPAPPDSPDRRTKRAYDFTPRHGRWIFALLTQLDSQLTSDEISILRNLVREVFKLIREERLEREDRFSTKSQVSRMGEVGCWMIVAAVTGVWGQRDLWNDATDALR